MKSIVYLSLLAIAGVYINQISAEDEFSVTISVSSPPPANETDIESNFTYVHNGDGVFQRIPVTELKDKPSSDFVIERDVRFELYTAKNPKEPQMLKLDDYSTVKSSNFNWWHPTRILIHGWNSEGLLTSRFAEAYFSRKNHKVNFIAVNWQKGSDIYNYLTARGRVNQMGEHVAKFVDFMSKKAWLKIKTLTIVGHSLGAHIAGIAGKKITRGKVGRIVGLDPAYPRFDYNKVDERLAKTDASYVEVIHTCAGTLGFSQPIGMANFYPNGGRSQPGCKFDVVGACAHGRAYEFYIESIVRPDFFAFQCTSFKELQLGNCSVENQIAQMGGEPGVNAAEGIYFLETNPQSVYSRGRNGILQTIMATKQHPYKMKAWAGWLATKNIIKQSLSVDTSPHVSTAEIFKQIMMNYLNGEYTNHGHW